MTSRASLNHVYRTVWNASLGVMVAVAETSRSHRGGSSATVSHGSLEVAGGGVCALALGVALAWGLTPGHAFANPTGGAAVVGQATFNPQGNKLVVTTQNGAGQNHSAINWQSFSIPAGNTTYFQQPSASSTSINRVVTNTPSQIFGTLASNGNLVVINQSGITVGKDALVDTAGFTASSLGMRDADAAAGRLRFGDGTAGDGGISVLGNILTRSGDVVLLGSNVATGKDALIQAPNGTTLLAAGQQIELTGRGLEGITLQVQAPSNETVNLGTLKGDAVGVFAGTLKHSGAIQADGITVQGGKVILKASDTALVGGMVGALAANGTGGSVRATANRIALQSTAFLDVSSTAGGGEILVGGGWQGKDASISNAEQAVVATGAKLKADATGQGNGGTIVVWADGSTRFGGNLSARGGRQGGNGGLAEVSGKKFLDFRGAADTSAVAGMSGTLLLDPDTLVIGNVAAVNGFGGDVTGDITSSQYTGYGSQITATQVANLLGSSNLSLAATGNITVSAPINKSGSSSTTLTLTSDSGNIQIDQPISSSGGRLDVNLNAPNGSVSGSGSLSSLASGRWLATVSGNCGLSCSGVKSQLTSGDFIQYNYTSSASVPSSGDGILVKVSEVTSTLAASALTGSVSKVYDGSASISLSGARVDLPSSNKDGYSISAGSYSITGNGTLASPNVGSGISVALDQSGVTLSSISTSVGITLYGLQIDINPNSPLSAAIGTVTPARAVASISLFGSREYDGTNIVNANIFSLSGLINGETLSLKGSGTVSDKSVGENKPVNIDGLNLVNGTGLASNYSLTGGTVTITPRTITGISGLQILDKIYDGKRDASAVLSSAITFSGLIPGDNVSLNTGQLFFRDANAGVNKPIDASSLKLGGPDAGNYTFESSSVAGLSATIKPVDITAVSSATRPYDGTKDIKGEFFKVPIQGVNNETLGLKGIGSVSSPNASATEQSVSRGTLELADGSGLASNYNLVGLTATAKITPFDLSVKGVVSRPYDRTTTIKNELFLPVAGVNGETLKLVGDGALSDKNVGEGKQVSMSGVTLVNGTGLASNYVLKEASYTANITKLPITSVSNAVNDRDYNGGVDATFKTGAVQIGGVLSGDLVSLGLTSATATFAGNGDVGDNQTVLVKGAILEGADAINYSLGSLASEFKASIRVLDLATWTGLGDGVSWSDRKNWKDGAVPSASNVRDVSLGASEVNFGGSARDTQLRTLSGSNLLVSGNNLSVQNSVSFQGLKVNGGSFRSQGNLALAGIFEQTAGLVEVGNASFQSFRASGGTLQLNGALTASGFIQSAGTVSGTGSFTVNGTFNQTGGGVQMASIAVTQTSGNMTVNSLKAGSVNLAGGSISQTPAGGIETSTLTTQSTGGTVLTGTGNKIGTWNAFNTGSGALRLSNSGLISVSAVNESGDFTIDSFGGVVTSGQVRTSGAISITSNSPLTVGAEGVSAQGNIVLTATNLTSAGNMTLEGDVRSSGGSVKLDAAKDLVQNGTVFGAAGVTAAVGGVASFGPRAVTIGRPVDYVAGGVSIAPPSIIAGVTSGAGGNAPTDFVLTFLAKFDKALEQQVATSDTPGEKKKDPNGVVVEGQTCTP